MNKNKNFWVIAYDITDDLRRSRIVKVIEKFGERVNYSVFECMLTDSQFKKLHDRLQAMIKPSDRVVSDKLCQS